MSEPLVRDVPGAPPPEEIFAGVAQSPYSLWLDSGLRGGQMGRFSFIAIDPFVVLRARGGRAEWEDPEGTHAGGADPLGELAAALRRYAVSSEADLPPFAGGAAGFFGYELARSLERLPPPRSRDLPLPDMELGFYDTVVGWDHARGRCWIASTGRPETGREARRRAAVRLEGMASWLAGGPPPTGSWPDPVPQALPSVEAPGPQQFGVPDRPGISSTFTPEAYVQAVDRAIELIRAGDIFQVNLSQRFTAPASLGAHALYERLRRESPAPFGAFFQGGSGTICSTSPEQFLHLTTGGEVQTRPIKGTRPREARLEADRARAAELRESEKDRAENLMIVDLLRNDLSRVCRPGSVRVTDLFRLESFANVHHLVSTVRGRLREGLGAVDLLRATFPCGSVTGAPKVRAMEIIAELEPVARGPYCGAIGYLGFRGDLSACVAIRILVHCGRQTVFHAGGAVVVDSDPVDEYRETLDKARGLMDAVTEGR